jgi:ketosteroid isomerase-like protein
MSKTSSPTSQENVEIVRAIWQAFAKGGFPAAAFADDVEWHTAADLPDRETCKGTAAIQQMLADGWATVNDPGLEVEQFLDAGERVVVRWRGWGRARASGLPMEWGESHTYEVANGKVVEVREYRTWQEALEAVGLQE